MTMHVIEILLRVEIMDGLMVEVKNKLMWYQVMTPITQGLNHHIKLFIIG
jgi:hypothetical protein